MKLLWPNPHKNDRMLPLKLVQLLVSYSKCNIQLLNFRSEIRFLLTFKFWSFYAASRTIVHPIRNICLIPSSLQIFCMFRFHWDLIPDENSGWSSLHRRKITHFQAKKLFPWLFLWLFSSLSLPISQHKSQMISDSAEIVFPSARSDHHRLVLHTRHALPSLSLLARCQSNSRQTVFFLPFRFTFTFSDAVWFFFASSFQKKDLERGIFSSRILTIESL